MTKTANRFNCMECGRSVTSVEYHPYWHCVLHKVGQLDQALKDIEAIMSEQVIGENEKTHQLESPVWNFIGGQNALRKEQRQALLTALYGKDEK